jgi:DNA-binding transcriptional LysR family regulator
VPRPLPSIESLRCFFAAAQQLNFRRAAAEVGLTATAFSERIRMLERELGAPLFNRTSRRVELTPEGSALLPVAEQALASVQSCVEVVARPQNAPVRLRIGTRFELGMSWLGPAVIELEAERASWQIDLYCGSGQDILERLDRGLLDGAITSAPLARAAWRAEVLHPETYALVGASALISAQPLRSAADGARHTLLDIDDSLPLARYLLSVVPGLEFARVRVCGSGGTVLQRVLAGTGVAVLPTYMIVGHLAAGRLQRLLPRTRLLSDSFRLLYRNGTHKHALLQELAAFLRSKPLC